MARIIRKKESRALTIKAKLALSIGTIALVMVVACAITMVMYSRMSNYVSSLIAGDIECINIARSLSNDCNEYHLKVLNVVGDDDISAAIPVAEHSATFTARIEELKSRVRSERIEPLADSVLMAWQSYMVKTQDLSNVLLSDFIDTRDWFFGSLQPEYEKLSQCLDDMSDDIFAGLRRSSATFDRGYYRSVVPGFVAIAVCILLLFWLLFFISVYYVNPLYKMLKSLNEFNESHKHYHCEFDGDDQLSELNAAIKDLTEENDHMRRHFIQNRHAEL